LGDLNCDQLCPNEAETKYLKSILDSFGPTQLIKDPTRITEHGESLLDIIITDRTELVESCGISSPIGSSDHCLTYVTLNYKYLRIHYRNYNLLNEETFLKNAQALNWKQIEVKENIDNKVHLHENSVTSFFDLHARIRTVRIAKNKSPYISNNTKPLVKLRDMAHRKFKCTRLQQHWDEYKELRIFKMLILLIA